MPLNSDTLSRMILSYFKEEMRRAFPEVTKNVSIEEIPTEDGGSDVQVIEEKGPVEINDDEMRPLTNAIARAVTDHIKSCATTAAGERIE